MEEFNEAPSREHTNAEKYVLRQKLFATEDVLPMWVADMDIKTPSFVIEAIQKRLEHPVLGYEEVPESLFRSQINWIERHHGYAMQREWMFYSPSVVATINMAIKAFTKPGDKVVVQTPVYFPFMSSVKQNGRHVLNNPLIHDHGDYRMDYDALEASIDDSTKLLLLCSPHNPVGRVWRREELQRLADICERHNVIVLADEIHSDLVYAGSKHIPFASLGEKTAARTVSCYGPGKTFNLAGLGISTVVISDENLREKFVHEYRATHFAEGSVLSHVGFQAAYEEGEAWLEGLLSHLQSNMDYVAEYLAKYMPRIRLKKPEGTYLLWLDCHGMELSHSALKQFFIEKARLGLSHGVGFGREGEGFMRMNIATPYSTVEEAMKRLHLAYAARFKEA